MEHRLNQYSLGTNLLVLGVILVGLLFALPNLFPQDPSIEVTAARGAALTDASLVDIEAALENAAVPHKDVERIGDDKVLVRFATAGDQLSGQAAIEATLADRYLTALTTVPDLPGVLVALGLQPMRLGLDLRGGIHVLIDVDMEAAVDQALERVSGDIRTLLRDEKVRYLTVTKDKGRVNVRFQDAEARDQAERLIHRQLPELLLENAEAGGAYQMLCTLSPTSEQEIKQAALTQNETTLRNRIDYLGVAEPIVQRQGERRILVQLPGVQDPSRVKEMLGTTATLEYRLVDWEHDVREALAGRVPPGSKLYRERNGQPVLLKRQVITTGDQITHAAATIDQRTGSPAVSVRLDAQGARRMRNVTRENVGKPMAVVFIENRTGTRIVDGEPVKESVRTEEVISIANILEPFGAQFQTTGLDSTEARDLAVMLRAGSLAAPIQILEERTIGPSLGQDNIDQGMNSVLVGLLLVVVFMGLYYRIFGLVADLVLMVNLVMMVAILSMIQATLTLPGIAGIVLTVGMAVDANVLVFERIREELRNGNTPQASIHAGYQKALSTILDANITTLIAAVVLLSFGTGPIKGFAVTLLIGILTSLFTAILGSRALINLIYGGRRLAALPI